MAIEAYRLDEGFIERRLRPAVKAEVGKRVDAEAQAQDVDLDGIRDQVIEMVAGAVMGEVELDDGGEGSLENDVVQALLSEARAGTSQDWMMDLVLWHRAWRGEEPELPDRVMFTVKWLDGQGKKGRARKGGRR